MEEAAGTVSHKVDKISTILCQLTDSDTPASPWCDDKENIGNTIAMPLASQPQSHSLEAFHARVSSFAPGLWSAVRVSPLECARWGWQVVERDVLQCVTCQQVLCATLPSQAHTEAYWKFVGILRDNIVQRHLKSCWWRHHPSSPELTRPPHITTSEQLHNLTNAAYTLASLPSPLPFINTQHLMDKLGVDEELVRRVFPSSTLEEEVVRTAVILLLCGWSKSHGSILRCQVCRRSVGLWSLYTKEEHLKKMEEENLAISGASKTLTETEDKKEEEEVEGTIAKKPRGRKDGGASSGVWKSEMILRKSPRMAGETGDGGKGQRKSSETGEERRSPRKRNEMGEGGKSQRKTSETGEERRSPRKRSETGEGGTSPRKTSESESEGGKGSKKMSRSEEERESPRKVEEGWSMQLRGRRVSEQSSDDGSSSTGSRRRSRRISDQSSDDGVFAVTREDNTALDTPRSRRWARRAELVKEMAREQAMEHTESHPSPLIIGSSPSTQIEKVVKKRYFQPLEEHRYWCTWVIDVEEGSAGDVCDATQSVITTLKGYQMVAQSVRSTLALASRKDVSLEKFVGNVEGLRCVRNLLSGLTPELS